MLHRLVRRAVLAVAHRVVREDEDRRQLHQGREPDRGPRVVAEDEEGRAEGPDLRQRQDRSRSRPSRARGCRSAGSCRPACRPGSLPAPSIRQRRSCSTVRGPPSRRAATGCSARARSAPCPRPRARQRPSHRPGTTGRLRSQSGRQLAPLHLVDLGRQVRVLGAIRREERRPLPAGCRRRAAPMPAAKCS